MKFLDTKTKNNVLQSMMNIIDAKRAEIPAKNKQDLDPVERDDQAHYDRLVVDQGKMVGMIKATPEVKEQEDPVGKNTSEMKLENGLEIVNKTDPFGTIMII